MKLRKLQAHLAILALTSAALVAATPVRRVKIIEIASYTKANCKGDAAQVDIDLVPGLDTTRLSQIVGIVSRSYKLSRRLPGDVQLDVCVTDDLENWGDTLESYNSACEVWKHGYFAEDEVTECFDTGPVTCFRVWRNKVLKKKDG
ncbi:hypothetical protein BDV19DRAFT_393942 [Aspergillus venezuelensis]